MTKSAAQIHQPQISNPDHLPSHPDLPTNVPVLNQLSFDLNDVLNDEHFPDDEENYFA